MDQIFGVAIGLVLVFAVFSVIVSSATEGIAGIVGKRSKVLVHGLEQMLGGGSEAGKAFVDKLYEDPLIVAVTSQRSGPSYLDKAAFTTALLNVTNVIGSVEERMTEISDSLHQPANVAQQGNNAGVELPTHLKKALTELWDAADRNEKEFVKSVEGWYDQQMERVSGWYGRWAQLVMFLIALLLAVALNMSATTIGRALWANPALQAAAVTLAQDTVDKNNATTSTGQADEESSPAAADEPAQSTTTTVPGTTTTTATPSTTVPTYDQLEDIGLPIGWTPTAWPGFTWALALHGLGWLLMAIAGSFGAPVWFDLLNKFVNLRVAGPKPDAASHST